MNDTQMKRIGLGAGVAAAGLAAGLAIALRHHRTISFRDRVVIITGGSRGLGLVMARQLADEGARLVLLARDEAELADAERELTQRGAETLAMRCDVADRDDVEHAIHEALRRFHRIDVLINNAGIIQVGPLEHMTARDFERSIAVHILGPLYTTLAAAPFMRVTGGGRIVNIASIGGKIAVPHLLPYVAGKFGLVGLSDGLRAELRKDDILVTTVCPSLMRTGSPPNALFKGNHRAEYTWFVLGDAMPGLSMSAERAASKILNACRHGHARLLLGWPAKAAVLFNELLPGTTAALTATVNRLLPAPREDRSPALHTGWESQSPLAPSLLTALSDRATQRNNEHVHTMTSPPRAAYTARH